MDVQKEEGAQPKKQEEEEGALCKCLKIHSRASQTLRMHLDFESDPSRTGPSWARVLI